MWTNGAGRKPVKKAHKKGLLTKLDRYIKGLLLLWLLRCCGENLAFNTKRSAAVEEAVVVEESPTSRIGRRTKKKVYEGVKKGTNFHV